MGQRGTKPTPAPILQLRGSRYAQRALDGPKAEGPLEPPGFLKEREVETWQKLVVDLRQMDIIGAIDTQALGRYCRLHWRWRDTEKKIDEMIADGLDVHDEVFVKKMTYSLNLSDRLLKLETQFGMTPSARAGLGIAMSKQKKADPTVSKRGRKPKPKAMLSVG